VAAQKRSGEEKYNRAIMDVTAVSRMQSRNDWPRDSNTSNTGTRDSNGSPRAFAHKEKRGGEKEKIKKEAKMRE